MGNYDGSEQLPCAAMKPWGQAAALCCLRLGTFGILVRQGKRGTDTLPGALQQHAHWH